MLSEPDNKDDGDDSRTFFDFCVDYNDAAYDNEDEEQSMNEKADTYFCNVILEHTHDEDGKRVVPLKNILLRRL